MKKKVLFTGLLALGLALTGCGGGDKPSTSDSSNTPTSSATNPNEVTDIKGNGTDWNDEIKSLLDKAYDLIDDDSIELPYVKANFYSAAFAEVSYKDNNGYSISQTEVIAYNSKDESVTNEERDAFMTAYEQHYSDLGYEIDKSAYSQYRQYTAQKKIRGTKYAYVNFGLVSIGVVNEYDPVFAYYVSVGISMYVSTSGFVGDYMDAWPTDGITEVLGKDLPKPNLDEATAANVQHFGGYNLIEGTNGNGESVLIEVYVLWEIGTSETDYKNYIQQLEDMHYAIQYDDDNQPWAAYDLLNGILLEFTYSTQAGFGSGIILFAYVGSDPFVKSDSWLAELSSVTPYVEEGKSLTYYSSTRRTNYGIMYIVVVAGVSENAEELYQAKLADDGWTVTTQTEDGETYYLATKGLSQLMFYTDYYAEVGLSLTIQAIL